MRGWSDVLGLLNELVDAYAISAIDVFGTAIVALAFDRAKHVPLSAKPYVTHLQPHAEALRALLDDE